MTLVSTLARIGCCGDACRSPDACRVDARETQLVSLVPFCEQLAARLPALLRQWWRYPRHAGPLSKMTVYGEREE